MTSRARPMTTTSTSTTPTVRSHGREHQRRDPRAERHASRVPRRLRRPLAVAELEHGRRHGRARGHASHRPAEVQPDDDRHRARREGRSGDPVRVRADPRRAQADDGAAGPSKVTQLTDAAGHTMFDADGSLNTNPATRLAAAPFAPLGTRRAPTAGGLRPSCFLPASARCERRSPTPAPAPTPTC